MLTEKEIRKEIKNILALEKANIKQMSRIINGKEFGALNDCISKASELYNQRLALEWVLSEEENVISNGGLNDELDELF